MKRAAGPVACRAVLSLSCALVGPAAQPSPQPPSFPATGEVVHLDMVVHDKAGKPVDDLREGEVQVFEDGVACSIRSFRLVRIELGAGAEPAPVREPGPMAGSSPPPAATGTAPSGPAANRIVLLVFDRLGPEAARNARTAAREFVGQSFPPHTWFAVFKIEQGLRVLQAFTGDRSTLAAAIDRAATGAEQGRTPATTPDSDNSTEEALKALARAGGGQARGPDFDGMMASMLWQADKGDREQRGRGQLLSLLAIAKGLEGVSGRKLLLYFSEGLFVPPELEQTLRSAVSQANRSNVSVYSFDARGLAERSPNAETLMALDVARGGSALAQTAGASSDGATRKVGKKEVLAPDVGLAATRMNVQGNLQDLAESTGGFLIANTNDLRPGLARVGTELRRFYEVAYVPASAVADGRFRTIRVKVSRPGVTVRTRKGYYALPPGAPVVLPYELALTSALEQPTPPRGFEQRVATVQFPGPGKSPETTLFVEVPLSALRFARDEAARTYRAHVSMLGVVRDEKGRMVARLSHDWPLTGPLAEAEATQQRTAVVKRTIALPPGRYTLETAAQDRETGEVSARKTRFDVLPTGDALALGSVVVGRADPAPADPAAGTADDDDPFHVGPLRFMPGLGKPIAVGTPAVSLLVSAQPGPGAEPVKLTLEFRRDGQVVAQAEPQLPPANARGRIAYVGSFPTGRLAPGRYEVWARASQGTQEATAATAFTIAARAGTAAAAAPTGQVGTVPPAAAEPAAAAAPSSSRSKDEGTSLETILERAGAYVTRYAETFKLVVAEELYRQWAVGGADNIRSRTLRSDLVFVQLPGPLPWTTFRDVYEVDGAKLHDRDRRLEKLFGRASLRSASEQANAILLESSRYNLGPSYRTVNVPTLGLLFLQPENQKRLALERKKGTRTIAGFVGVEVTFKETTTPTLVHDRWRNDVPASGRYWIDPTRGTVLRSEIRYDLSPDLRRTAESRETAFVNTEYRREPALDVFVPGEMTELYDLRVGRIETKARYANFRRFEVTTEEKVGEAGALPPEAVPAPAPPPELPMIGAPPRPDDLAPLLTKVADYVAGYEQRFRNLAATEVCRRREETRDGSVIVRTQRSVVVFAMVSGDVPWLVVREPVPDKAEGWTPRLEPLFRESPERAVREWTAEAAPATHVSGDLTAVPRTPPTIALAVVRPENRDRYRFELRAGRPVDGADAVEIAFAEMSGRTQVQDGLGRDLQASGRLLVRERDGAVLRAEIKYTVPGSPEELQATTEFRSDAGLGLLAPAVLRETLTRGTPALIAPTVSAKAPPVIAVVSPRVVELTTSYEQYRRIPEVRP